MERNGYPILGKEIAKVDDESALDILKEAEWENILFDIEKGFEAHKDLTADDFVTHADERLAEATMQKGLYNSPKKTISTILFIISIYFMSILYNLQYLQR